MIELEVTEGIAVVMLDREPVNALNAAMVEYLGLVIGELEAREDVRVVVVRSARHVFCAGADIAMLAAFLDGDDGAARLTAYAGRLQNVLARWSALPVPSIAEVGGAATGGGLELALACDIRLAADTARVGLTEANLGLVPGAGGTQRLTALVGSSRAMQMLLTGELVDAGRAVALGLVDEVLTADALRVHVDQLAAATASRSREVVVDVKRCVAAAGTSRGFHVELEATERLASLPATQALMKHFLHRDKTGR